MKVRKERKEPQIVLIIVALILITLCMKAFVIDAAIVQGRSMLPGLGQGDIVFYFKAAYGLRGPLNEYLLRWGSPREGDIVVALRPDSGTLVIKRVIDEGASTVKTTGTIEFFYLLGDNYYESVDSREFGPVPMNNILGKVLVLPR